MTPIDEAFEALKDAWKPPAHEVLCVGDRLWSIEQWITYCSHCRPVPINEFEKMLGEAANRRRWMPAFDDAAVSKAIQEMPDCELKLQLLCRRAELNKTDFL